MINLHLGNPFFEQYILYFKKPELLNLHRDVREPRMTRGREIPLSGPELILYYKFLVVASGHKRRSLTPSHSSCFLSNYLHLCLCVFSVSCPVYLHVLVYFCSLSSSLDPFLSLCFFIFPPNQHIDKHRVEFP